MTPDERLEAAKKFWPEGSSDKHRILTEDFEIIETEFDAFKIDTTLLRVSANTKPIIFGELNLGRFEISVTKLHSSCRGPYFKDFCRALDPNLAGGTEVGGPDHYRQGCVAHPHVFSYGCCFGNKRSMVDIALTNCRIATVFELTLILLTSDPTEDYGHRHLKDWHVRYAACSDCGRRASEATGGYCVNCKRYVCAACVVAGSGHRVADKITHRFYFRC